VGRRPLIPRPALWRGLSRRLLLATMLTTSLAAAVMILFVTHQSRETTAELSTRYGMAVAAQQERRIDGMIDQMGVVVRTLAGSVEAQIAAGSADRRALLASLHIMLADTPDVLGLWIVLEPDVVRAPSDSEVAGRADLGVNAEGRFAPYVVRRHGAIREEVPIATATLGEPWYALPRETLRSTIVEPFTYPVAGAPLLMTTLSMPIVVEGTFRGVAGIDFAIDDLSRRLADVHPLGGTVGLMSGSGTWIAGPRPELIGTRVMLDPEDNDQALSAIREMRVVDLESDEAAAAAVRRIVSPFTVADTGTTWAIVLDLPEQALDAPARDLRDRLIVMAGGMALLVTAILGFLIMRMVGVPLARTSIEIRRLSAGRIEQPVGGGERADEIGHVNRALEDYRESLVRDRRLREELLRILSALDLADEGILVAGGDDRVLFANMAAARVMALPGPGHLAGEAWTKVLRLKPGAGLEDATAALASDGEWAASLFDLTGGIVQLRARALPEAAGTVLVLADMARARDREASRRGVEARLRQAQKMEAVGQLTGGIAHDFNNLLTVILGNGEFLAGHGGLDARGREAVSLLLSAGDRAAALVAQLLAFARRQPLRPQPLDVAGRIADLLPLLTRTMGDAVTIAIERAEEALVAAVDGTQLDTAIINLCLNARDAMVQGGRITIGIRGVRLEEDDLGRDIVGAPPPSAGPYVLVQTADTGTGIPASVLSRVFEPFFTTKPVGAGSGLGLPMVYGFATQSGGGVAIESRPGVGTVVRIWLPRIV
jgi:signal transduction histidine kinase